MQQETIEQMLLKSKPEHKKKKYVLISIKHNLILWVGNENNEWNKTEKYQRLLQLQICTVVITINVFEIKIIIIFFNFSTIFM